MRVAIVGSRSISDYALLEEAVRESGFDVRVVVSGGARGVDSLAERYAKRHGCKMVVYVPEWEKHGRGAGMLRNAHIVNDAEALIALWDGKSRGTRNSIARALARGIPTYIHDVSPKQDEQ